MTSVLFCYDISVMAGFVRLRVGFGGLRDLNDGRFSVSVVFFLLYDFLFLCFFMRFQRRSVLFVTIFQ